MQVLFRDPSRVALTRTAVLGIFSWDSELLQETAEAAASIGRWIALRFLWHATVLDPLDSLVWFYEDLEERPLGSLHALCRFLRLEVGFIVLVCRIYDGSSFTPLYFLLRISFRSD